MEKRKTPARWCAGSAAAGYCWSPGGGSVRRNGAYDAVTASLEAAGIPFTELSDVQANPRSGKVYEGIDLVRRTGADFLLALGGGSVIDTAKAIGFGALYKGDFWDFFTGAAKIEKRCPWAWC